MAETPFSPDPSESGAAPLPSPANAEGAIPDTTVTADTAETAGAVETPGASEAAGAAAAEPPPASPTPTSSEPVSEPEPAPPAPQPAPPTRAEPGIAATLDIPAQEGTASEAGEGGGEFDLLLQKIRDWLASGELQAQWQRIRGPLKGLAILVGVVLLLRVYASLVGTLDSLPLVGGLLELVGLITLTRFSLTRLVRRSDREQVFAEWGRRWNDFRGRD